jgi:hypothetical protein
VRSKSAVNPRPAKSFALQSQGLTRKAMSKTGNNVRPADVHDGLNLDPRVSDAVEHAMAEKEALPNRVVREFGNDAPDQRMFGGRLGQRECLITDPPGMEGRIPTDGLGDGFETIERAARPDQSPSHGCSRARASGWVSARPAARSALPRLIFWST